MQAEVKVWPTENLLFAVLGSAALVWITFLVSRYGARLSGCPMQCHSWRMQDSGTLTPSGQRREILQHAGVTLA